MSVKRTCARCRRFSYSAGWWPDGPVCRTCVDRGLRLRGTCPGCGQDRLLPGLRPDDHEPICTTCAEFKPSYRCSRCGQEGKLHSRRLCSRCALHDRLSELLDDGTGQVHPRLLPLFLSLTSMENPLTGLTWLYEKYNPDMLRGLADGTIDLTHEAFHQLPHGRAASHLRELLMACGLLPEVDKQICLLERWLVHHLDVMKRPTHRKIIHRFATWEILPRLRRIAQNKTALPSSRSYAGQQIIYATRFLAWLAERRLTLDRCRQGHLDAWIVEHTIDERNGLRTFLDWAARNKLARPLELPRTEPRRGTPLAARERLALLGRMLTDESCPLRTRVAATLVLLYAQPVSRLVQLDLDDIITDDGQVAIRFGDPPTPVPEPFAILLQDYIAHRTNMRTATNPGSQWLFPGRRAGQPLRPEWLAKQITQMGVPTTAARGAALRQHLQDSPAPIVADALGFHPVTAAKLAAETGTTYSRYAPGDHTRSPRPLPQRRTDDS
ncbi:hypothetical protein [Streptosporangium sp. NBC_01756]|uniref:hypothetical protein n=1 Tax=Streptosporangium sp. NBC_01756 TaxID=2975950 RepID=UPI002DDAD126|nr:hypothetical protein [Streptosporangium sp. NBC_01756]WSC85080.1 hypothetical protein OIE48_32665 [Streptosporangium sp. NBC_01756]